MCGMLDQQKEPRHNKETAGHNPYRRLPPRLFMLFVVLGIRSVRYAAAEQIVKGANTAAIYQPHAKLSMRPRK
jgi:hypothetical protein